MRRKLFNSNRLIINQLRSINCIISSPTYVLTSNLVLNSHRSNVYRHIYNAHNEQQSNRYLWFRKRCPKGG